MTKNIKTVPVLLAFLLSSAGLIWPCPSFASTGGKYLYVPSTPEEAIMFRNVVTLAYAKDGGKLTPFCSAVATGPFEIMTARHCLTDALVADKQIYAKFRDPRAPNGKIIIPIKSNAYETKGDLDMAIAALASPAPTVESIPFAYDGCDDESDYWVAGIGYNDFGKNTGRVQTISTYSTMTERQIESVKRNALKVPDELKDHALKIREMISRRGDEKFLKMRKGHACFGDSGTAVYCRANGVLAIAGVLSGLGYMLNPPSGNAKPRSIERCNEADAVIIAPIQGNESFIENWRLRIGS